MAVSNSLLGPILGGLLGFLGAIGATIIALILARRERVRRMDKERIEDGRGQELDRIVNVNGSPHQGTIDAVGDMHRSHHWQVEFHRYIEGE